jgi:hypothetical protein
MTFMYKQCAQHLCLNNMNTQMTSMFTQYKFIKNKFCMKFVMLYAQISL